MFSTTYDLFKNKRYIYLINNKIFRNLLRLTNTFIEMKKLLLFAAIVVFGFTTGYTQTSFGVKAGVNLASLSGDDADDLDGHTTMHIGGVANIGITELFSVQPELLYSRQGFKDKDAGRTGFLDYITVPVMADFKVAEGLSLQGGPQIGININAIVDDDNAGGEVDINNVESLDIGVGIGAQYKLPAGLFLQARYMAGLNNVFEEIEGESLKAKNSVISVSVGWFFD